MVEVLQDFSLCDFGNVVHGLACIVPNPCILIGETSQHRRNYDFEIARELLARSQPYVQQEKSDAVPSNGLGNRRFPPYWT